MSGMSTVLQSCVGVLSGVHALCDGSQGVVKLLLSLWTDTARCRGTLHDIERDLYLVDQSIGQVQFPTEMPRKPRGLKDHLSNWKGALYTSCLLAIHSQKLQMWHRALRVLMSVSMC